MKKIVLLAFLIGSVSSLSAVKRELTLREWERFTTWVRDNNRKYKRWFVDNDVPSFKVELYDWDSKMAMKDIYTRFNFEDGLGHERSRVEEYMKKNYESSCFWCRVKRMKCFCE